MRPNPRDRYAGYAGGNWCGRPDLNRHRPCGPTDFRTPSAFAAAQDGRSWSGLSLHPGVVALGAARLVSTPSLYGAWLGITSEGFPEFEQFYSNDFSLGTHGLSPVRLPFRHARTPTPSYPGAETQPTHSHRPPNPKFHSALGRVASRGMHPSIDMLESRG